MQIFIPVWIKTIMSNALECVSLRATSYRDRRVTVFRSYGEREKYIANAGTIYIKKAK